MTEMIRELMIQSVGAFLAVFGFCPAGRYAGGNIWFIAGITGGAGWLAYLVSMQVGTCAGGGGHFFSSLASGSAEPWYLHAC